MKALVNVRLGSSRLPKKVFYEINGKKIIDILIERILLSKHIEEVIVNTSTNSLDDLIEEHCLNKDYRYSRGSEDDVLLRMCDAVRKYNLESFVEVFGDCPLVDFRVIDKAISFFKAGNYDFVGNDLKTTYPPGFEVEIIDSKSLLESEKLCSDIDIREHGSLFIRQNKDTFRVLNFEYENKILDMPHLTLDTQEDFDLIKRIYIKCIKEYGGSFSLENVLDTFGHDQSLKNINSSVERKWKQYRED